MKFASKLIALSLCVGSASAIAARLSNGDATITVTTVSNPKAGITVTETSAPMELASFYRQEGLTLPANTMSSSAQTSAVTGTLPSTPTPPAAGSVRPYVNRVDYMTDTHGWNRDTVYTRDVTPTASGFEDGAWVLEHDNLTRGRASGGRGKCTSKDYDCRPANN
jgi:hypothetical protein